MGEIIRLLLVEDAQTDAELAIRELKRAGMRLDCRQVEREDDYRRELETFRPEVIISDFSMPHFDGMSALRLARELLPEAPFIFLSGTIGEEYAIRALKNGAADYVLKSNLVRLPVAVERALHDAREKARQRETARALAETRERLASITESLPDVIWSIEFPRGRAIYVSPAALSVYGRPHTEFLAGSGLRAAIAHPEDQAATEAAWQALLKGHGLDLESRILMPDGSARWVHERARIAIDAGGRPARIDGLSRDVTESVRQREHLARLSRIRDLLGSVNAACMRIRIRRDLFGEFCRIAVSRGGFVCAYVVVPDTAGRLGLEAATANSLDGIRRIIEAYNLDPAGSRGLLPQAIRTGQLTVSNDIAGDGRVANPQSLSDTGSRSVAIMPVKRDGDLAAITVLCARETGFFDQEENTLIEELTGSLEFALELEARQERVDYLAFYDPLTELPNRTLFRDRLTQVLDVSRQSSTLLALHLFDLQRFKAINDSLGQGGGDNVLRLIASRLRDNVGDINRLGRLGGNLFAVMRPGMANAADAMRDLEETLQVISLPLSAGSQEVSVTAKAGIALFPGDGDDADTLFRNAEASLRRAKETGERYLFYAPNINTQVAEQVVFETQLRHALERRELFLLYQPKVDLVTRRILGLEALMRWRGPEGALISPARFVPVLEDTGMILAAGRLAFELAAEAHRGWRDAGLDPPRVAVNVSAMQLHRHDFVDGLLEVTGGRAGGIDIEITESLLMNDVNASIAKLAALREAGLGIALDDFGTGHSSLAYLSRLPIDTLKIDRSFVLGMTEKAENMSIITTIISLSQALRLNVVAEGVETEEQARLLRLLRCDQMQGYLFSPPVAAEAIETLLRQQAAAG